MRTNVPEKLQSIVEEIESQGSASLTRLTVLKKWFEYPGRLPAFGLWMAKRAAGRKGKTKAEAGALLNEARALLGKTATREDFLRLVEPDAAKRLHDQCASFTAGHSCWWSRDWRSISARRPPRLRATSWRPIFASTMIPGLATA